MLVLFKNKVNKVITLILLLSAICSCQAQHYDIKLFDRKVAGTKNKISEAFHEYKRIQKVNKEYIRGRELSYKELKDSVNAEFCKDLNDRILKDSLNQLLQTQQDYFVYEDSLFSLSKIAGWDTGQLEVRNTSLSLLKKEIHGNQYYSRYLRLKDEIGSYGREIKIFKDSLKSIDTLEKDEIRFLVSRKKKELSEKYEGNLESITRDFMTEKMSSLPDGFQNKELVDFQQANRYLKNDMDKNGLNKLSRVQATDHFKDKQEILKTATNEVDELKKKFSEVTDSKDLSTAKKNGSLKGSPINERMVYGGTFQVHINEDVKIDLNPEVAYRLNERLEIGVGGTYRLMVVTNDLFKAVDKPLVIGFRGFVEHKLIKRFYLHGEYESLKSSMRTSGEDRKGLWYYRLLTGVERRFALNGKLQGQAQVLYNFNSQNNPLYNTPWVFRLGFNLSEK